MLLSIILLIAYLILGAWLLPKLPLIKKTELPRKVVVFLWLSKCIFGLTYFGIYFKYYWGGDTYGYFLEIQNNIKNHADEATLSYFFTGWTKFNANYSIFSVKNIGFYKDLSVQLFYRLNTMLYHMAGGKILPMIVLHDFLSILGQFALYLWFKKLWSHRNWIKLIGIFFIPSVAFWCSGMHKDGLMLSMLGLSIYYFSKWLEQFQWRTVISFFIFSFFAVALRHYLALALLPGFILWALANKYPNRSYSIFGFGLLGLLIIVFNIHHILPSFDIAALLRYRHDEFSTFFGSSDLGGLMKHNEKINYFKIIPKALGRSMFYPLVWKAKDNFYLIAALETIILNILLVINIFKSKRASLTKPYLLFIFFISIILFLFIGLLVPFQGAFIRYRSVLYPLLHTAVLLTSTWSIWDRINERLNRSFCKF